MMSRFSAFALSTTSRAAVDPSRNPQPPARHSRRCQAVVRDDLFEMLVARSYKHTEQGGVWRFRCEAFEVNVDGVLRLGGCHGFFD